MGCRSAIKDRTQRTIASLDVVVGMEDFLLILLLRSLFLRCRFFPLSNLGPEVLGILLLRGERELTLDAFVCLGRFEFNDELTWSESISSSIPLAFVFIFKLL